LEVKLVGNTKHLAEELDRLIGLYEHYKTGTVKELARDLAIRIAKELSKPFELDFRLKF